MKCISLTIFIMFLMGQMLFAQSSDSVAIEIPSIPDSIQKRAKTQMLQQKSQNLKGFVDFNANGVDDRIEKQRLRKGKGKGKGKNLKMDRFIDLDGDGICDGRESGIGLRKIYRKRKRHSNSPN